MNYLAHMYLSCSVPELMCGNFLGDLMNNKEMKLIPEKWLKGLQLHRKIDSYTDNHPSVKACTKMLHKTQRKYSPVVIDVFFDYLLFLNWKKYSGITFYDFEIQVYDTLLSNIELFPERIKPIASQMIGGKFLRSSISLEGLAFTFRNLKKKMKFKSHVEDATTDFLRLQESLDHHFNLFFPDVIEQAERFLDINLRSEKR